jgi:hypothetical protein
MLAATGSNHGQPPLPPYLPTCDGPPAVAPIGDAMLELNAEERIQLNANGALCHDGLGNET